MTLYISYCTVVRVEESVIRVWDGGVGKEAKFHDETIGWSVVMNDHSVFRFPSEPEFIKGDRIQLTLRKVPPTKEPSYALDPRGIPPKAQQEAVSVPIPEGSDPS